MDYDSGKLLQEILDTQKDMEERFKSLNGMIAVYKFSLIKDKVIAKSLVEMPIPLFLFTADGRITAGNRLFCTLTGLAPDGFQEKDANVLTYIVHDDSAKIREAINDTFSGEPNEFYHEIEPASILALDEARGDAAKFTKAVLYPVNDENNNMVGVGVFMCEKW